MKKLDFDKIVKVEHHTYEKRLCRSDLTPIEV